MTKYRGVIFDLDGVIVSTDEYHFKAWKRIADEEGIYFDRKINDRLRGVSRLESLDIILERSERIFPQEEKLLLASRKNTYYKESLNMLTEQDILPGVMQLLIKLKESGFKIAIGSSSKNAPLILEKIGLSDMFDAIADGNQIKHSKPDPEVFLLAARLLQLPIEECIVVEDAEPGIQAACAAGSKPVAVGSARGCDGASYSIEDLSELDFNQFVA